MIRATVDTSVLAPAIRRAHTPESSLAPILRVWRAHQFELVISTHILDELRRTLATPHFNRYLAESDRDVALNGFRRFATIVPITIPVDGVATHPEDDLILATALSGGVDYLVTLDRQLLGMGSHGSVRIVSPRAFLAILHPGS